MLLEICGGAFLDQLTTTQTVRHFLSAPTQPNSTKFSIQPYFNPTRRFMQKKLGHPPPKQLPKFSKFDFEPILKKMFTQTFIYTNLYFNLNPIGCGTAPGNLVCTYK